MKDVIFKAKRIDCDDYVEGHYFKTPLTDENSGLDYSKGLFFLSDGLTRHCIESDGVVFTIDHETMNISEVHF